MTAENNKIVADLVKRSCDLTVALIELRASMEVILRESQDCTGLHSIHGTASEAVEKCDSVLFYKKSFFMQNKTGFHYVPQDQL